MEEDQIIKAEDIKKEIVEPESIKKDVKRLRKSRRKEIRLLTRRKDEINVQRIKTVRKINWRRLIISITSLIVLAVSFITYQLKYGSCEFWAIYERNYNKIVYGDEMYCFRKINSTLVYEKMTDQVVGQLDGLELIRGSLNLANNDGYIQMIFNGSTGTGKTLSSQIIASHFPNSNVQKYIWAVHKTNNLFEKTRSRLSKCGYNLIILDDLENTKDAIDFLKSFEQRLRFEEVLRNRFKIVLIAIFKKELTDEEDLKDFVIVDFQPFTLESFIKCIKLHQKFYNAKISPQDLQELTQIDYLSSGCKLISKKLSTIK